MKDMMINRILESQMVHEPEKAFNRCHAVSERLYRLLKRGGIPATLLHCGGLKRRFGRDAAPGWKAYIIPPNYLDIGRAEYGKLVRNSIAHYAVAVQINGELMVIDSTASQFGWKSGIYSFEEYSQWFEWIE